MEYLHREIEAKWQRWWEEHAIYKVRVDPDRPKFYVLDMFPYPSGAGLHVGHPLGYIASDIISRYKRMEGCNVLHPMGFDAFGLPAEQYAIQTGVHPAISTRDNIARYRDQLRHLGFDYDWSREVVTSDPSYYRWTQWIFLRLFSHWYDKAADKARPVEDLIAHFRQHGTHGLQAFGAESRSFTAREWSSMSPVDQEEILMNYRLAYRKESFVNWCEALGTVLANDEVKDGLSERGGHPVERKPMLQWSLRITAYAERLLGDLEKLDWSDALKTMQRNWIGRSEGAQVFFQMKGHHLRLEIFTTRPDTIFGVSFMVLAPEHEWVQLLTTPDHKEEMDAYLTYVKTRTERERQSEVKQVTGVFTGAHAIHPFTGVPIPVWVSEYVLKDYGAGAIMAVPADDERDRAFAEKFHLPVPEIIDRKEWPDANREDRRGRLVNSGFLDGMLIPDAIEAVVRRLEQDGCGTKRVNYKLRDALFSRQRYWGEPFPIVYNRDGVAVPVPDDQLPVTLPDLDNFEPTREGKAPLARLTEWVHLADGSRRETDTMPGYAGSSWYFLRYMDAGNASSFAGEEELKYWREVDFYIGGTEHAVGHLMYARFWHKFLFDLGRVPTSEPFRRLVNQGMIQGVIESLWLAREKKDGRHYFLSADLVEESDRSHHYVAIPVLIDFVRDYGTDLSYLDGEGLDKFVAWRPEYREAIFECEQGVWQKGQFIPKKAGAVSSRMVTYSEVGKMSKSKYNVINPDDVVATYGADCFRMYEMFLGPIEQSKPWDTKGIDGVSKFLRRFWAMYVGEDGKMLISEDTPGREMERILHQTIRKVRDDLERLSLNTCISHFMICLNELRRLECRSAAVLEPLIRLLAPFAPHITEELWHRIGHQGSVHLEPYPVADPGLLLADEILYPVSINGKKRAELKALRETSTSDLEREALSLPDIQRWLQSLEVKKVIVVPGRMINIVAG